MKTFLALVTAASAFAAMPAAAQYAYPAASAGASINTRIAQLEARLNAGISSGYIDRREARHLRWQLGDLRRLRDRYSYNGLSQTERWDLDQRVRDMRQSIRLADGGRFDRDMRYGYWDDRYYGQGGPFQTRDACRTRGGLGGAFDSVFGNGCLHVGDRATGNLFAVPYEYRSGFPDGNGVFYRSDGRAIYEIDARTNMVVGVYAMDR